MSLTVKQEAALRDPAVVALFKAMAELKEKDEVLYKSSLANAAATISQWRTS